MPGTDGQKMSKSYGNTIEIFGEEKAIRKRIMGLVMDSRGVDEPKPDAGRNIALRLMRLVADPADADRAEERLRAGGYGYGSLKKDLFERCWEHFRPMRERRRELESDPERVEEVLRDGAERAAGVARDVLRRARRACGLE